MSHVPAPRRLRVSASFLFGFLGVLLGLAACPAPKPPPPPVPPPAAPRLVPPLHDAVEGEELVLARGTSGGEHVTRFRVIAADDLNVTVEVTRFLAGQLQPPGPEPMVYRRNGFGVPEGAVIREIVRDRIDVEGTGVDCWRMRVHSRQDVRVYWISEEYPVHGVIQIDRLEKGQPSGVPFRVRGGTFPEPEPAAEGPR